MIQHRATRYYGALALFLAALTLGATPEDPSAPFAAGDIALIVQNDCPVKDVKMGQLIDYLRLERQFWPDRKRVVIFLPPADSAAKAILNERVYRMDEARLRKYWVGKVFAGDIPVAPQVVRTPKAAGKIVAATPGAISVVPIKEVPEGVRVLKIDGLLPGEKGYPLNEKLDPVPKPAVGV